jgi:hypothetical protein
VGFQTKKTVRSVQSPYFFFFDVYPFFNFLSSKQDLLWHISTMNSIPTFDNHGLTISNFKPVWDPSVKPTIPPLFFGPISPQSGPTTPIPNSPFRSVFGPPPLLDLNLSPLFPPFDLNLSQLSLSPDTIPRKPKRPTQRIQELNAFFLPDHPPPNQEDNDEQSTSPCLGCCKPRTLPDIRCCETRTLPDIRCCETRTSSILPPEHKFTKDEYGQDFIRVRQRDIWEEER